ncbi:hypothetical protein LOD99_3244 [Oopsacas minuta]|uniref:Adenosine kinase n=1 Tax=Oopsacas minuta TaxID=111878 RepID=A0AAV7JZF0_9METZ|nr:hypothetical protein LOD99_3244 [Oopsacas minuta]
MAETVSITEGILFGMGNPLLDISANVEDEFIAKYKLESNNAILAKDEHLPIYEELVDNYKVEYLAGGATQNTIRTVQWLSQKAGTTSYIGCVGNDENANKLRGVLEKEGTVVHYMTTNKNPTGTCAVLVNGKNRSLVANIAAANNYSIEHLQQPENWALVEKASFFYVAGFFFTVNPESIMAVAKHATEKNKVFSMNISAPFLAQFYLEPLKQAMEYADFIFANEHEYKAFAEHNGWGEGLSLAEIGLKIAALPKAGESKRHRYVIMTQSIDPVLIAHKGEVKEYPVPYLKQSLIVDSNSAGDAFVGGFLFQLIQGQDVSECVRCGCYGAQTVLQMPGCTFPGKPSF